MTANLTLALLTGVLIGCGVSLVMARGIVRSFLGVLLMGNGVNLLFLIASGKAGRAPIVGTADPQEMSDPLPQAMVLTAIVITLALTGFVLALAHRSWQLARSDVIVDDTEDARIHAKAAENDLSDSEFTTDEEPDPGEDPDPGGHRRRGVTTRPAPIREEPSR
ncbi:Na(+)/H(+) antiporter subunit C [Austwickia chelonae]|uniref:Na(+)/H(+) antiporter subunit C n=1 Tax=Austwickia chelonae TaxID=100225 RepID=UPI000E244AE4|nr:Na(+)/H(+) antiporter subunit C [Austwickia chelonae]